MSVSPPRPATAALDPDSESVIRLFDPHHQVWGEHFRWSPSGDRILGLTPTGRALAVSATNGCAYCVNSHTAALRKLGLDAEAVEEVLAVTALFNSTNALADGYQIEPDVLPPLN